MNAWRALRVALVGATGLVGREFLTVLEERKLRPQLHLVASKKSVGQTLPFHEAHLQVQSIEHVLSQNIDVAVFSAGAKLSKDWAPRFTSKGTWVIDNSSAWRLDHSYPLLVAESRDSVSLQAPTIIANPNCSTIQLALPLEAIHKAFTLKKVVVSTYQAVSGAGASACLQLEAEQNASSCRQALAHPILGNLFPHIGAFDLDGHSTEERKIQDELRKILQLPQLPVYATCVRVATLRGHAESVYVETQKSLSMTRLTEVLKEVNGLVYTSSKDGYTTPLQVAHRDEVFLGRVRIDESSRKSLQCWIVADNLRKGAATNAFQILEILVERRLCGIYS